jgi:putative transcriptional regulator
MNKVLFDDLLKSIQEAVEIKKGTKAPAKEETFRAISPKLIRVNAGKSQKEFARMIGVSLHTLRNWEQGRRSPHGPARVLLMVAAQEPEMLERIVDSQRTQSMHPRFSTVVFLDHRLRTNVSFEEFGRSKIALPVCKPGGSGLHMSFEPNNYPPLRQRMNLPSQKKLLVALSEAYANGETYEDPDNLS